MSIENKIELIIKSNLKGDELISLLNEYGFENMSDLNKDTKYMYLIFGFKPKLDKKDYFSNTYIRFDDDFNVNEVWGVNISSIRTDINLIKQ